ncbi:MAG TPA: peptidoglycan DD-metalloendopeptidase family protein, partial [Sandaracinaceae bacterium]
EVAALREQRAALERATYGMLAALGQPPADADPWSSTFGLRVSDAPAAGFAALRGQLPLPIGGSTTLADAQREGGEGLELSASVGASVRAVAAGRVAYAAPHPAYGQLVILDHGDGYYTVYGGLALVSARVGQSVPASAPIGIVGAAPLFFQVRRGTRPLSAREWLGV